MEIARDGTALPMSVLSSPSPGMTVNGARSGEAATGRLEGRPQWRGALRGTAVSDPSDSHPTFQQALAELGTVRGEQPPARVSEAAKLAWAAREFEAYFLEQVWRVMRESLPKGGFLEPSAGERLFTEMLDGERAYLMAASGQTGLAAQIYERTIRYVRVAERDR